MFAAYLIRKTDHNHQKAGTVVATGYGPNAAAAERAMRQKAGANSAFLTPKVSFVGTFADAFRVEVEPV